LVYRLGVDLGTTWSAAAAFGPGGVETIALGARGPAMPSVVARADEGFVCGDAAERRLLADPTSGVRECKRRLGDATPFVVGGAPYGAEALLGQLLAGIMAKATEQMGEPPDEVVLTYPAAYGDYKLDLVREVAKLAGVESAAFLTEPEAAAIHYARLGKIEVDDVVAVYDFGGGTFDAAVLRRTADGYDVLGQPEGLERLGGVDVDQAVLGHVDSSVDGKLGELDGADPEVRSALARLREECTAAKEALSEDTDATIPVAVPGLSTQVRLTRSELEAMVQPR
jgi:molecular chaperone DnaK (HSP70)